MGFSNGNKSCLLHTHPVDWESFKVSTKTGNLVEGGKGQKIGNKSNKYLKAWCENQIIFSFFLFNAGKT